MIASIFQPIGGAASDLVDDTRLYVLPCLAVHHAPHSMLTHAELPSEFPLTDPNRIQCADCANRRLVKSRAVNIGASSLGGSSLCGHVVHVLGVAPQKEMVRVDAQGLVASVAYAHTFSDRLVRQFPRESVSADCTPTEPQLPISVAAGCGPKPQPALGTTVNPAPESRLSGVAGRSVCATRTAIPLSQSSVLARWHEWPTAVGTSRGILGMRHSESSRDSGCVAPGAFRAPPGFRYVDYTAW